MKLASIKWNRSAHPPLLGIEAHPNHIADYHDSEVHGAERKETRSKGTTRHDEKPLSPSEVDANLAKHQNDEKLTHQEPRVWDEPGIPFLHGWQKRDMKKSD
jgi:hypothetical protein